MSENGEANEWVSNRDYSRGEGKGRGGTKAHGLVFSKSVKRK